MRKLLPCLAALAAIAAIAGVGCSTSSSPTYQVHDDCPRSIAQYCSSATCTLDYAAAKQAASACAPNTSTSYSFAESCGGFNVLTETNVDVGTTYYYGASDGKLVAIVGYSANFGGSESCVAGNVPKFTAPGCASGPLPCETPTGSGGGFGDGGADAGDGGDGSLDAANHD